jgi:endonuclease-3
VLERLEQAIPVPRIELDFASPWQLLVATILSAQSTDRTVNRITPDLFRAYPTPAALGAAPQADVERIIKPTGFFRNKAKAIREASRAVAERFGGAVPRSMDDLIQLPGVARKTANVVLGNAYGVASGIAIDTHAGRVARRLGLTREEDPVKVEAELCAHIPRDRWIAAGLWLQLHGRYVCTARAPRCSICPLNELCPSREERPRGTIAERAAAEREIVASQRLPGSEGAPAR